MTIPAMILQGGSDETNGDYSALVKHAKSGRRFPVWSVLKRATPGDLTFFYIQAPHSSIVAMGTILEEPNTEGNWDYEAAVGEIEMLHSPITLEEIAKLFPKWGWHKYPRGSTYLNEAQTKKLLKRAAQKKPAAKSSNKLSRRGAGFGTADQNRQVEQNAVNHVSKYYKKKGYVIESRESEQVGYDLHVAKGSRELHVEVKGVTGNSPDFIITRNEVRCAQKDPLFRLAVVTSAMSRSPQLKIMTGTAFLKHYARTPISYSAKRR